MRVHTFVGILLALLGAIAIAYLTQQNSQLIQQPFRLTETGAVPLYLVLVGTFLVGFLPVVVLLLVETLKHDLAARRQRRFAREERSLRGSYRRAVDFQLDGQWGRAATELEAVLANQPDDFDTLLRLGEALRNAGRSGEALEIHRRASILYPQSVAVLYQLADDYQAQESPEVAREIADRILRDYPGLGLRILRQRRDAAIARGDWTTSQRLQEAITVLLPEPGSSPDAAEEETIRRGLRFERGVELLAAEHLESASGVFEAIAAEAPTFKPAFVMLGEALLRQGDPEGALSIWDRAWETTGSPIFLQRIEDFFIEREEPMEAIEYLYRIIAAADDDLLPRLFLAKLYARLEMHEEALRAFRTIRDQVHESPSLLLLLGRVHERRGEQLQAGGAYRASLEQLKLEAHPFHCDSCGASYREWQSRCEQCGGWDSIELRFDLRREAVDETALHDRPVWPDYGGR